MMSACYQNRYCFADIPVQITHRYAYLARQCENYITELEPQLTVDVTEADVARERERAEIPDSPEPYLESLACYRKFCSLAVSKGVLLFHSSAIAVDGVAYLFAAPSGTGKSTHTALWRRVFGERAVVVNDDKPLLRLEKDRVLVYGTPWDGKHRLSTNVSLPVGGICFLSRGKENRIAAVSANEGLPRLLGQTFRPDSSEQTAQMLSLAIELCARVPLWSLACNISEEAVHVAYNAMRKDHLS